MNSFNLPFIVAIFALTLFFASCDDIDYYKRIKKLATDCTTGPKSFQDPDSPCNTCTCLADGVVICTRVKCVPIDKPDEPEQNLDEPDEPEQNLEPEPEPEPEADVEPEAEALGDDAKDISVYKKLQIKATGCIPGTKLTLPCFDCFCILPGVLRCNPHPC